jgi:hypothetical protein
MYRPSESFAQAARDYLLLVDRGYAREAALKLVGDHHQLPRDERLILYRGLASSAESSLRGAAIVRPDRAEGRPLLLDAYNQALTILHYVRGRPVFIGTDGLVRDVGGSHGRIVDAAAFAEAVRNLAETAAGLGCGAVTAYLDAPVSGSAGHAELFRRVFEGAGLAIETRLEKSADAPLKIARGSVLVASGDSAVADAVGSRNGPEEPKLIDLARAALERNFPNLELLDLRSVLASSD